MGVVYFRGENQSIVLPLLVFEEEGDEQHSPIQTINDWIL